jgi:hypothetical protein
MAAGIWNKNVSLARYPAINVDRNNHQGVVVDDEEEEEEDDDGKHSTVLQSTANM